MIRFANPGSDINQLVKIFKTLFSQLSDFDTFDLNNMADIMTSTRMASSKGYIGEEALKRSYSIKDTSRNPLYNQAKMYAEIYRLLGWIISSENSSLSFKFTLLGYHVAIAENNTIDIVNQSFLGINFPNNNVNVKFTNISAPFFSILEFSERLDGIIRRDEIIVGPLNMNNSFDKEEINESIDVINQIRKNNHYIEDELSKISKLNNSISINTMKNYTRIIISELKHSNWYTRYVLKNDKKNLEYLKLTEEGISVLSRMQQKVYITYKDLKDKNSTQISALCKWGFTNFLKDSNFEVSEELIKLEPERAEIESCFKTDNIFFNPFQVLSLEELNRYFPESNIKNTSGILNFSLGDISEIYTPNIDKFKVKNPIYTEQQSKNNSEELLAKALIDCDKNVNNSVVLLLKTIETMKQKDFYPLIADLLSIIFDINARLPQAGVNNERFDVIIDSSTHSVPVEVKSPTEELMLSTKSVRQALENKIILLSRKHYQTTYSMTSMVVGFNIPNDRSDVFRLINDIKETYNINITLLDIKTLLNTALNCIENKKTYLLESLDNAQGVLYFENI
ncbi:hypothetical protein [Candidatus Enterococcus ikei]|uniref:Uncharacterized protein n=1 Tax=Candidatus Enterococcus ikei TaxID=2815326 RepID=A0ABS3GVH0_9ENTE|nr:hypothetical protein [Enterococcus sp. DIV0869a]MBO0439004.1 hypothetical protein [Enterococcus sp. DIV0869a]